MKQLTRLITLILCAALILSMVGCTTNIKEPSTQPTEPQAADIYNQARTLLDSVTDVTLELLVTTHTTVDGDEFSEQSSQTLTYQAIGTDAAIIALDEEIQFSIHNEASDSQDEESEPVSYKEIWSQGTVYAELTGNHRYCGPVDAQAAAARYAPVVLLDASLYGSITSEASDKGTVITFAEPTAAEGWALPQEGELVEASGTVLLNTEGILEQMHYTITYTYGPSEVTLDVESKPLSTPKTVAAPADLTVYTPIDYVDALRMYISVPAMLMQTDSAAVSGLQSVSSEAAGVIYNQSATVNVHGREEATVAKVETGTYFMDYTTMESEKFDQEETFLNGSLTTVVNNGLPSTTTGISWEDVREYVGLQMLSGILDIAFWQNVTVTDMGSVYLLEYQLNDNFGNSMQNSICSNLWNDPSFLYNLASEYKNTEVNGYLSVDKYTGLPVAAGHYYQGVHTIDGQDYALSLQFDQSIEAPAKGAYQEITDLVPQEEAPENKPTPLFYHVTGEHEQEMWLFGTIHVGDARTAYLPEEIYDAFTASDALALECDSEAFEKQLEDDDALSEQVSGLYFYSDEQDTLAHLMEEDDYAQALKLLKAVGGYNMNMPYAKPYLWSNTIDLFYLRQGYQLHSDQGVEARLHDWAETLDKDILEVESNLFQIQMSTGFSSDLQLLLLETSMESSAQEYQESTMELYEMWCAGDEDVLRQEIANEWDTSEMTEDELAEYTPLIDEYYKAMHYDRNEGMLKKAVEYLESGDVVFYAVGLAHLLDDTNGLVDALQEAGYTVEQVTYSS